MGWWLGELAGWVMLASLVYAPWALGGKPIWAISHLEVLAAIGTSLWLASLLALRRRPATPPIALGCMALLLALGWGMTGNAHSRYDARSREFVPISSTVAGLPGSVDSLTSRIEMTQVSALFGLLLIAADAGREERWRRRIFWTIALCGGLLAAFGVAQRLDLISGPGAWMITGEGMPFATFNYHGNAAAYIDLIIPIVIAPAVIALREEGVGAKSILLTMVFVVCLAGAMMSGSRAGQVVALGLLAGVVLWGWRAERRWAKNRTDWRIYAIAIALLVMIAAAGGVLLRDRWATLPSQLRNNPRVLVWKITWRLCGERRLLGAGPGTFKLLFPRSPDISEEFLSRYIMPEHVPGRPVSMWNHAHNDYLQTLLEWGWIGTGIFAVLIGGAMIRIVRRQHARGGSGPNERIMMGAMALSITGLLAHAAIDFPMQLLSLQVHAVVLLGLAWGSSAWESPITIPHFTRLTQRADKRRSTFGPGLKR